MCKSVLKISVLNYKKESIFYFSHLCLDNTFCFPFLVLLHISDAIHPSYRVMFLSGLVHTLSLQADASLPAGRSLHCWQFLGQTHHLSLADHSAPQSRTYVHARADCVLGAEGQATLADCVVALSRELLGAKEGLVRRIEETLGCGKRENLF